MPVAFADSHVHLASEAFDSDIDDVIARARAAGARALVCIGESPAAALRAQALAARYPGLVWHTCGVHPHDAATWNTERDGAAIRASAVGGAVAVGECGLDYHYDHSPRAQQLDALNQQLELAAELALPLVLHTREAEADTFEFLTRARALGVRGVLHCFTGSHALATAGLDANWFVSFSGLVTFRNFADEALLKLVPRERLLVESDAPYLAPVPHRGKRNESAWVLRTIERLAAVRGETVANLAEQTLANTQQLFSLPSVHPTAQRTSLGLTFLHPISDRAMAPTSIHSDDAPKAIGPYSQAVVANGFLFTAGQIALDPMTMEVVPGGITEQSEQVLKNLSAVLAQAGATWGDVVKTNVFLRDMADFSAMNAVYARVLGDARPARSTVAVAGLPRDVRVEIELVAALPSA